MHGPEAAPEFNLEETLRALARMARAFPPGSQERTALHLAVRAFLFLHEQGELESLHQALAGHEPGFEPGREPPAATWHRFASLTEALRWLESTPQAGGSLIEVEQSTYTLTLGPEGAFLLVHAVSAQPKAAPPVA